MDLAKPVAVRRRARRFGVLAVVLAVLALRAAPADAQLRLYVQAFERGTGAIVTDLEAPEVMVREDGVVRPVIDVRPANLPTKLVVLVDNSRTAARAFGPSGFWTSSSSCSARA